MINGIPTGQVVGTNIEIFLFLAAGGYYAWLRRWKVRRDLNSGKLSEPDANIKLSKPKPWVGYLLLIAGVSQIAVEAMQVTGVGQPPPQWAVQMTDDGLASVEFPGKPTRKEGSQAVSFTYNIASQDVSLILSSAPIVDKSLSDDERIEAVIRAFVQQGFSVNERKKVRCGDVEGHALTVVHNAKHATGLTRFAFANNSMYRAIASFPSSTETKDEVNRFIESFHIRREK